jgi:hypothetical protein
MARMKDDSTRQYRFDWSVIPLWPTYAHLCGVTLDEVYRSPAVCADVLRRGREKVREIFGPEIHPIGLVAPPVSYGHLACLGAEVLFPYDSEPSVRPFVSSLEEGLQLVEKERPPFEQNALLRRWMDFRDGLRKEFPEEKIPFGGFGAQGPVTSCVLARGQSFYADLYDAPEQARQFLLRMADSIAAFRRFLLSANGQPEINPQGGFLTDDFASLISPGMWPEFVLPAWDRLFRGITTGSRSVHVENLTRAHLPLLKQAGIVYYDPSVSSMLSPKIIRETIEIPYCWLIPSFKIAAMPAGEIAAVVEDALIHGAGRVWTEIDRINCEGENPAKIRAFVNACQRFKGS